MKAHLVLFLHLCVVVWLNNAARVMSVHSPHLTTCVCVVDLSEGHRFIHTIHLKTSSQYYDTEIQVLLVTPNPSMLSPVFQSIPFSTPHQYREHHSVQPCTLIPSYRKVGVHPTKWQNSGIPKLCCKTLVICVAQSRNAVAGLLF